jgi:glyoxylase-like metal-dependent hydrolase (beta-lactamase superfamily II)
MIRPIHSAKFVTPLGITLLVALQLVARMASAQSGLLEVEPRERPPFETVDVTIHPVAGNIYQIRGEGGNIGMSVGADGIILIDDQFAPLTDKIMAAIRSVSDAPIRFLINTHVHEDHTGGNANFAGMGAIIMAHDRVRVRLMEGIRGAPPAPHAALPVVTFSAPITLHLNGEEVRIIPVPAAHTDGDIYVHFVGSNVIHLGDVFRTTGYPNIDIGNGGTLQGTLDSLQIAIDLAGPDTQLVPGHGAVSTREAVTELRNVTLEVRDRVAALVANGMTFEQIVAAKPTADLDERWGPRLDRFLPGVYYGLTEQN